LHKLNRFQNFDLNFSRYKPGDNLVQRLGINTINLSSDGTMYHQVASLNGTETICNSITHFSVRFKRSCIIRLETKQRKRFFDLLRDL